MNFSPKSELVKKLRKNITKSFVDGKEDLSDDEDQADNDKTLLLKKSKTTNNNLPYGSEVRSYSPAPEANRSTINSPIEFDSLSVTTKDEDKSKFIALLNQLFRVLCDIRKQRPHERNTKKSKSLERVKNYLQIFKTFLLLSFSLTCIVLFSLSDEKEQIWTQSVISNLTLNKLKCSLNKETASKNIEVFRLKLFGPFADTEEAESSLKFKFVNIDIYGKMKNSNESVYQSSWKLFIKAAEYDDRKLDQLEFSENALFSKVFELKQAFATQELEFIITTNIKEYISFNFDCQALSSLYPGRIYLSAVLLLFVYVLIIFELCHRFLF